MLARAVRVATIRGVEVRLDPSLVLLALLLAWLLWFRFDDAFGTAAATAMAAAGSLLFFASILAHELGHAFEAQHRDIEVHGITLLLFGGVTEMHSESRTPRDEFVVAAVGPYLSLVCAGLFHLLAVGATTWLPAAVGAPVAELARLLAFLNLLLALFNLVPGAPLDGGRVLRAGLWWLWRDRTRAVRGAARAGQAFAVAVVAFGVIELAAGFAVAAIGGLWWLLIGAFLFRAATAELRRADANAVMDGRTTRDVLGALPSVLDADTRVASAMPPPATLDGSTAPGPSSAADHVLVRDRDGEVTGWIPRIELTDRRVRDLDASLGEVASAVAPLPSVAVDAPLPDVLDGFRRGSRQLRVTDGGRTVAVLTERRAAEALRHLDRTRRRPGVRTPA